MEPGIVFLGTGTGKFVTGRQLRATGGFIITLPEFQMHIDPGPGALVRAKQFGVNPRDTSVLIVTHNHLDHANDVNAVISAMTYDGFDKRGVLITNETVVNGSAIYRPFLQNNAKNFVERIIVMEPGKRIGIETIEMLALPTKHSEEKNFGLKIISKYFTITYTSDTEYDESIVENYKNSDIFIVNCVNLKDEKNNLSVDDVVKIIYKALPKLVILTHFGEEIIKENPINIARAVQQQTKTQTIAAYDGMTITPSHFAARFQQQTLKGYEDKKF